MKRIASTRPPDEEGVGVVEFVVLDPGRADEDGRTAVAGLARQGFNGGAAGGLERGLEHKVFRRVAGDEKLGKSDDVSAVARGFGASDTRTLQIAGDVADDRIELRHRNGEAVGGNLVHGQGLAPERPLRQWARRDGPGCFSTARPTRGSAREQPRPRPRPGLSITLRSRSPRRPLRRDQARSKRSAFITLVQAATKSFTNFSFESAHA